MLCDICKTNEARISIAEEGDFCFDCHNARIAKVHNLKILEHFAREIVVRDPSNRPHRFVITNLVMPGFSEWKAEEDGGGYQFSVFVKPEDDQAAALIRLHRKVITGLQHQTLHLQDSKFTISNALQTDDGQYCINETGCGRIEYDEIMGGHHLIIDGRPVSGSDFLNMLSQYEGRNLCFQVRELSDDILGKGMILIPVRMDAETILDRIEETLSWFLDGTFLSYKCESACNSALVERLDEYELLCRYGDPALARTVGQAIIDRLLAIDHDTDDFPDNHVNFIRGCMPVN